MSLVVNWVAGKALSIECSTYCIVPNFQGTAFLQIDLPQNYADQHIPVTILTHRYRSSTMAELQHDWYIDVYEPLLEWQTTVHCFHKVYHACI